MSLVSAAIWEAGRGQYESCHGGIGCKISDTVVESLFSAMGWGERAQRKGNGISRKRAYGVSGMPFGRPPDLLLPDFASFSDRGHEPVLVACSSQNPVVGHTGI